MPIEIGLKVLQDLENSPNMAKHGFAAGASRDQIKTCETELGIPLQEFIDLTLKAMQNHSSELGL